MDTTRRKKNLVNNYEAINEAGLFRKTYINALQERVTNGRKVFSDPNYKWKSESEKKNAKKKFEDLEVRVNDYNVLYDKIHKLAKEHEDLVDLISDLYMVWYTQVAYDGRQQTEMMQGQADALQEIFSKIHEALKDICPLLPYPKKNEKTP